MSHVLALDAGTTSLKSPSPDIMASPE